MKITLAAGLLMAATPICAIGCGGGAYALVYVKAAGINAATFECKGLPGIFANGPVPKDPNDPAQEYLAQVQAQGKRSSSSPCLTYCGIELAENPMGALNTLLGQQKTSCEAAGGTYKSRFL